MRSCCRALLGALEVGDVEGHAVDKPRRSIGSAHHAGIAVEPDDAAVARHDAVGGAQRLAGEKHARRLPCSSAACRRDECGIPADRIFEPLFARVAEGGLDLRADIGLADAAIEIGHENDGWNLFEQRAILCFEIRRCVFGEEGSPEVAMMNPSMRQTRWPIEEQRFGFAQIGQSRDIFPIPARGRVRAIIPFGLCEQSPFVHSGCQANQSSYAWMCIPFIER